MNKNHQLQEMEDVSLQEDKSFCTYCRGELKTKQEILAERHTDCQHVIDNQHSKFIIPILDYPKWAQWVAKDKDDGTHEIFFGEFYTVPAEGLRVSSLFKQFVYFISELKSDWDMLNQIENIMDVIYRGSFEFNKDFILAPASFMKYTDYKFGLGFEDLIYHKTEWNPDLVGRTGINLIFSGTSHIIETFKAANIPVLPFKQPWSENDTGYQRLLVLKDRIDLVLSQRVSRLTQRGSQQFHPVTLNLLEFLVDRIANRVWDYGTEKQKEVRLGIISALKLYLQAAIDKTNVDWTIKVDWSKGLSEESEESVDGWLFHNRKYSTQAQYISKQIRECPASDKNRVIREVASYLNVIFIDVEKYLQMDQKSVDFIQFKYYDPPYDKF